MTSRSRAVLAVALLGLAGCNLIAPYPTAPAAVAANDPGPRVAICYNPVHSTLQQVRALAQQECGVGGAAEPVDTDWRMDDCAVLLPTRATFICTRK